MLNQDALTVEMMPDYKPFGWGSRVGPAKKADLDQRSVFDVAHQMLKHTSPTPVYVDGAAEYFIAPPTRDAQAATYIMESAASTIDDATLKFEEGADCGVLRMQKFRGALPKKSIEARIDALEAHMRESLVTEPHKTSRGVIFYRAPRLSRFPWIDTEKLLQFTLQEYPEVRGQWNFVPDENGGLPGLIFSPAALELMKARFGITDQTPLLQ